jgi:hypothetical protein
MIDNITNHNNTTYYDVFLNTALKQIMFVTCIHLMRKMIFVEFSI